MMWSHAVIEQCQGEPSAVLLDLDGTLIDSVPDLTSGVNAMLAELGFNRVSEANVSVWIGNGADVLVRRALAHAQSLSENDIVPAQHAKARAAFDQGYLHSLHHATGSFDGVDAWLECVPVAKVLITNKPRLFTEPLLASLGWEGHFELVLCADDLPEKKPSPMPLLHACQHLGVAPHSCLMVGDSKNDIEAARLSGCVSVAVSYGYNHGEPIEHTQPDLLVHSLSELFTLGQ